MPARTLQPFESFVLVPAIRVDLGNLVCRRFRKTVGQLCKRGVCLRDFLLAPACARHNQEPRPFACFAFGRCHSFFKFAFEKIGKTETGMRPRRRRIQLYHAREFGARFGEPLRRRQVKGEKCSRLRVDRI